MKLKPSGCAGLVVVLLIGVIGTYYAYQVGKERFLFEVTPIDKFVPVPNIYHVYSGGATLLPDGRIKATLVHQAPPPHEQVPFFKVVGTIPGQYQPYYVLSTGNKLYLEKAEHIDPLIHALCALSRGGPEENHPKLVADSIAALPEDQALLIKLVKRFPKKEVPLL